MNMNDGNPNQDPKSNQASNPSPNPNPVMNPNPNPVMNPSPMTPGNRSGMQTGPAEVAQKLRDATGNVMLRAGAGTGKTFNLTQKVLHLLTGRKVRLDQILVLTFTDFAAAEMRERIYDGLNKAIQKADDPDLRSFLIREKREFPSNYISTFHSFCNRILQYYPDDVSMLEVTEFPQGLDNTPYGKPGKIRLDSGFEILGGYEEILQKQEIRRDYYRIYKDSRVLKNQLNNLKAPDHEAFCGQLQDLGEENLVRLTGLSADGYIGILRGITDKLKQESDELFGRVETIIGEYRDDIKDAYLAAAAKGVGDYLGLSNNDGKIPKKFIHNHADKDEIAGEINPLNTRLKTVNALIDSIETTISDPALEEKLEKYRESGDYDADFELYWSIRELAELSLRWSSYQRFRRVKMARLNFDDIIWLTRRLLDSSDAVAADLRNRFEYVLVDEFQDTDREQWEIVKKLSRITDKANVLVVGDVKQAIYGFRGGDVTVMDQAARDMQAAGFEQLSLDFSFRSNPAVTNFSNELFRHCFGRQMDAPYIAKSQDLLVPDNENARNRMEPGKVVILDYDASVLKAGDVDPALEERVKSERIWLEALRIARMLKRISEGDEPGFERVTRIMQAGEKAAGILLRTRTNQYLFEMALKKYGLPYTVSSGRGFFNRQEINDIGNLLRFLLDAFDDLSLVGVLRSPWVGLSDNGLLAIRNAMNENPAKYPTFWPAVKDLSARDAETLIPPDRLSLELMTDVLEELRRNTKLMRVSELIESALLATNFFAGYRNDRQVVQNVNKLLTVIREMELNGEGTLFEIVNFLTTQAEEEADEKDAELPETGSIQIMTIHGSKGLEFPMVVLADTASAKGGGGVKLHMTPSDERAGYSQSGDQHAGNDRKSYNPDHRVSHHPVNDKRTSHQSVNDLHTSHRREIDQRHGNDQPTVLPCFSYNVKDREWNDNAKEGDAAIHAILKAKSRSREDAEMRRLFYVALTRAETHLVIGNTLSYPGSRRNQSTFALYLNDWLDTLPRPELFEQQTITAAETAALLDGDDPYITGSAATENRELRLIPRNRLDELGKTAFLTVSTVTGAASLPHQDDEFLPGTLHDSDDNVTGVERDEDELMSEVARDEDELMSGVARDEDELMSEVARDVDSILPGVERDAGHFQRGRAARDEDGGRREPQWSYLDAGMAGTLIHKGIELTLKSPESTRRLLVNAGVLHGIDLTVPNAERDLRNMVQQVDNARNYLKTRFPDPAAVMHEVEFEIELIQDTDSVIRRGILDMLLQTADGNWHLIDFKSAVPDEELILHAREAGYHFQLREYCAAAVAVTGGRVVIRPENAMLLFTAGSEARAVTLKELTQPG